MKGFLRVCFIACLIGQFHVALGQVPVITSIPVNTTACGGSDATINVVATGNPTDFKWQSTYGDGNYTDLTDGGILEGTKTSTLTIHTTPGVRELLLFRCIAHNSFGWSVPSETVSLLSYSGPPSAPRRYYLSKASVCAGTNDVLYSVTQPGDEYGFTWSYTGTGVTAVHHDGDTAFLIRLDFAMTATSGILSMAGVNACGTGDSRDLSVTVIPLQSAPAGLAGEQAACSNYSIDNGSTTFSDPSSCSRILTATPSGAHPVTGNIQSCVTVDASVQTYNGIPYVQRHYNIEPTTDPSTSTATLTLYFTQGDFDAYNLARGTNPALPINSADAAGISNLRITQFHGTGTTPGTYTGTTGEIDPDDDKIVWNATDNRWEVTFDVTGFSGFFASTGSLIPLPLTLTNFDGQTTAGGNLLKWTTASEQNTARFEIQRHTPGNAFATIAKIPAAGNSHLPLNYQYTDNDGVTNDTLSYRLRMVDLDGQFTYSKTVVLQKETDNPYTIRLSPNPYHNNGALTITAATTGTAVLAVTDISGRQLFRQRVSLSKGNNPIPTADIDRLPAGAYLLSIMANGQRQTVKLVKY